MGLNIRVGDKYYYGWPYRSLHELRAFAARKEFPDLPEYTDSVLDSMYKRLSECKRFKLLINHSDFDCGYLPDGLEFPRYVEPGSVNRQEWPSAEKLMEELKDLKQYYDEMPDEIQEIYGDLLKAAEASIREVVPMEFM